MGRDFYDDMAAVTSPGPYSDTPEQAKAAIGAAINVAGTREDFRRQHAKLVAQRNRLMQKIECLEQLMSLFD